MRSLCSGMEIHQYMSAKSAFMLKMLRLSNQLTGAEIEDIRRATSSAVRIVPIRLGHLVMREFVINDVDALVQAGLAPTMREAEELAVIIIRNAGMAKRKHAELAVLVRDDEEGGEVSRLVGRVGVSIVEDINTISADGALRQVLDAMPAELKGKGHMNLLYAFFDPRRDDATMAKNALDVFKQGLTQTVQVNDGTATDTDSETVWHLLEGSELLRIDDSNVEGVMVFQINVPT
jgi:hypothetical protein